MVDDNFIKCRSCGAEIKFIEMEKSGKKMPVNPKHLSVVLVNPKTDKGHLRYGYEFHFSTCPDADKHRKG